jgi:tetratricopeptide (TPR) repeat protein
MEGVMCNATRRIVQVTLAALAAVAAATAASAMDFGSYSAGCRGNGGTPVIGPGGVYQCSFAARPPVYSAPVYQPSPQDLKQRQSVALGNQANDLVGHKRYAEAIRLYKLALELAQTPEQQRVLSWGIGIAYSWTASAANGRGDYAEGLRLFELTFDYERKGGAPEHDIRIAQAGVTAGHGFIALTEKNYELAVYYLERALQINPQDGFLEAKLKLARAQLEASTAENRRRAELVAQAEGSRATARAQIKSAMVEQAETERAEAKQRIAQSLAAANGSPAPGGNCQGIFCEGNPSDPGIKPATGSHTPTKYNSAADQLAVAASGPDAAQCVMEGGGECGTAPVHLNPTKSDPNRSMREVLFPKMSDAAWAKLNDSKEGRDLVGRVVGLAGQAAVLDKTIEDIKADPKVAERQDDLSKVLNQREALSHQLDTAQKKVVQYVVDNPQ